MAEPVTYSAAEVDPIFAESAQLLDLSALALKEAKDENERLRKKAEEASAKSPEVVLQKVAFDPAVVSSTLDALIEADLLNPMDKQAMTEGIEKDPNLALKLASRVLTISANAPSEGGGLSKLASESPNTTTQEEDPWKKVREKGA